MTEIRFFVPGIPSPGGSKRAFGIKKGGVYTGRTVIIDAAGQKTKFWRASVGQAAADYTQTTGGDLATGPLELELLFHMPRPKSHFRANGTIKPAAPRHHVVKPDAGKLARSTTDALKGILWLDDCQIVKETHEKAFGHPPGCWIIARPYGSPDQ